MLMFLNAEHVNYPVSLSATTKQSAVGFSGKLDGIIEHLHVYIIFYHIKYTDI